ncbi:HAMP domain-containing sensor histidine kinase [Arcicella rigui]|uniref:histidine kinase n=1 Tax=Arcicella rigui TaxID=797020 RepID=A0ABU5QFV6_9BACT|nr:ATP-binding protein [Arcicella rigui]MEA5141753.1 ATP-binding protein [Arcicella rigui]
MTIRERLSLLFTLLTAAILMIFAALVYYSAYQNRETEFYNRLKKEGITKANLYFTAKVEADILQKIYKNNRETINEVEVAIYDTDFNLHYHDALDIDLVKENQQMMDEVKKRHQIRFYQGRWQVIGMLFPVENKNYIIIAAAYDQYGYKKLDNLRNTILIIFVCSILFIYAAGRFFSKKALLPVSVIVNKVKKITASNLDLRLSNIQGKDELAELSSTFNEMLDRLEKSFDAQKQFVSNISHELRTPLASIITELELSKNRERSIAEYQEVIQNTLNDAQKLARLATSLLDFAKASYDLSEISFRETRLDEVLLDARHQVQRQNPTYLVDILYENEVENDDEISINGNEYLLKVAFANLIENACKFSDNQKCTVSISVQNQHIRLYFVDEGIGIADEELSQIFTPFFRGKNKKYTNGNGIGLSLTQKIVKLHNGEISVASTVGEGTTFKLSFSHL